MGVGVDYAASSSTRGKSGPAGATRAPGAAGAPRGGGERDVGGVLAERRQDALGRAGDDRPQQDRRRPQALGQAEQRLVELAGAGRVLGEGPGGPLLHEAVEALHEPPDVLDAAERSSASNAGHEASAVGGDLGRELPVVAGSARHDPVAVAADHADDAVQEVAELVGELPRVARLEALGGEGAVLAEAHLAREVVAQRVDAVAPR